MSSSLFRVKHNWKRKHIVNTGAQWGQLITMFCFRELIGEFIEDSIDDCSVCTLGYQMNTICCWTNVYITFCSSLARSFRYQDNHFWQNFCWISAICSCFTAHILIFVVCIFWAFSSYRGDDFHGERVLFKPRFSISVLTEKKSRCNSPYFPVFHAVSRNIHSSSSVGKSF